MHHHFSDDDEEEEVNNEAIFDAQELNIINDNTARGFEVASVG